MKVKLIRDARIRHYAGEIVEVSPEEANFLISCKSAEEVKAEKPKVSESVEVKAEKPKKAKKQEA